MSEQGVLTFESTREAIEQLAPAMAESDRTLVWVDSAHALGVARDASGRVEIFIVSDPIVAHDRLVNESLEHQVWTTSTGNSFPANRLVLPSAPHFDSVGAFICAELAENGVAEDPPEAFRRSEAVIALALRRAALSNQSLVGLSGELLVLARLVESVPGRAVQVVDHWYGSGPSTRDLQLGSIGIEIKTTTGSSSVHHIHGLHQVEPGLGVDDVPETQLFLLSLGIEWLPVHSTLGWSLPELVDVLLAAIPDANFRETFLARVKQYGGDASVGYDHDRHQRSRRFARRFQARFERLYDLKDERLHLLHTRDVEHAVHVDPDSIAFRVRLPEKVRGDINPIAGMPAVVEQLTQFANGPEGFGDSC